MMKKAGYIERGGLSALDEDGIPREMISLSIHGTIYGIRAEALIRVITGAMNARIERIERNWKECVGGYAGRVRVSKSGKALNIELSAGCRYTVSLDSVRRVMVKRERFATIVEIPAGIPSVMKKNHLITEFGEFSHHPCTSFDLSGEVAFS
ncbi:MAG: hypothetical protein LUQ69_01340 [Methanoregulaceae archaeon]|nr:hypothetical protein [Methanoregulaceae archaeon]